MKTNVVGPAIKSTGGTVAAVLTFALLFTVGTTHLIEVGSQLTCELTGLMRQKL